MAVILNVPLHGQVNPNSCWNASAQMIWSYWQQKTGRQGPMNSIPEAFARSKVSGLYPVEFIKLARNVGMLATTFSFPISESELEGLIKAKGPLWCAGYWWGTSAGHVVVATGISTGTVHLNDPAPQGTGSRKTKTLGVFNSQLANNVAGCLMYKDPIRY